MDYEKAYKAALETATKWIKDGYTDKERICLESVFPELRESEDDRDERIRKELVEKISNLDCGCFISQEQKQRFINYLEKQKEPEDRGEISDGYHTFNELYYYRMLYNAAFFNFLPKEWVHKSKRHHDGEECFGGGWFIVMANLPTGQVSNHYELKDWDLFQIPEKEIADEWDRHTPQEAAERLHKYLLEKQKEQTEELSIRLNGLMQEYVKAGKDEEEQEHRLKCYQLFLDALGDSEFFKQKEQKPAEWSEEDEKIRDWLIQQFDDMLPNKNGFYYLKARPWLRSLRPQIIDSAPLYTTEQVDEKIREAQEWKPSEEQIEAFSQIVQQFKPDKELESLYNDLKKLGVKEEPEYYQHFDSDC